MYRQFSIVGSIEIATLKSPLHVISLSDTQTNEGNVSVETDDDNSSGDDNDSDDAQEQRTQPPETMVERVREALSRRGVSGITLSVPPNKRSHALTCLFRAE